MADSELLLPGDFDDSTVYMLKGKTLNGWRKALLADRVVPGPGLAEFQTPEGRIFSSDIVANAGPFKITGSGTDYQMQPGRMYWKTDITVIAHDEGSSLSVAHNGLNAYIEQTIEFDGEPFVDVIDILGVAADRFGIHFETDSTGSVTTAEMDWEGNFGGVVEFDPENSTAGDYFQPVVEFAVVNGNLVAIPIIQSAFFWTSHYSYRQTTTIAP